MSRTISIDPITRLEGHGKIDILLDDAGNVADAYLQVVELRGFEAFCQGRPVEELPRITPKICGVCPGAHHMAAAKACDAVFGVEPPPAAKKLRELFLSAHIVHSHLLHFFALAAPDFVPGASAPAAQRNLLGLVAEVGLDVGRKVLETRGMAQRIQGMIAGHPIHPVAALPGGMSKPLSEPERAEIETMAVRLVDFSKQALELFRKAVLGNAGHAEVVASDTYRHETYYAGLVDPDGRVSFYDGEVRVVSPSGAELAQFAASDYLEHIAEKVVPWSYLKVPYLKAVGYRGIVDGADSGIFRVNSLARLNVASGMATPLAQEAYEAMYAHFGARPVHHTLAYHWARLIECLYCAERTLELARDPEVASPEVRTLPSATPKEGVGVVEAARGTLYHHYRTDSNGLVKSVNLIVATVQNNGAMNLSVKKAAAELIRGGEVSEELLDRVEMAFRAYDPCLACATHALPGQLPLVVRIHGADGQVRELCRDADGAPCVR
ncbi:MAG: Ni/Fe hydrogenase subunit alpha [Deltaproteobacteria bacterium]|jgi:F420-non-reducing hydrogenase large subunit|nr:Ni/Fe hydrogenase subunit alpha [Deltaproteobacteria bacterium]MBW2530044.1 Ni/Fe hydrogenase subunit alpha [Deltaproteobacteria bacterium]